MDDLSFIDKIAPGRALIVTVYNNDSVQAIKVDFNKVENVCPALAQVCSDGVYSHKTFAFENKSYPAVISFLRHIYSKDYTFCEEGFERPCSLLLHLQVLELGILYNLAELQQQVCKNITQEVGNAAQDEPLGLPLLDLPEGIRFLYTELRGRREIQETIARYCVTCFTSHELGDNEAFRQTAFESPMFHRDLQHANNMNMFKDENAERIVQLPVCSNEAHAYGMDFTCQLHADPADMLAVACWSKGKKPVHTIMKNANEQHGLASKKHPTPTPSRPWMGKEEMWPFPNSDPIPIETKSLRWTPTAEVGPSYVPTRQSVVSPRPVVTRLAPWTSWEDDSKTPAFTTLPYRAIRHRSFNTISAEYIHSNTPELLIDLDLPIGDYSVAKSVLATDFDGVLPDWTLVGTALSSTDSDQLDEDDYLFMPRHQDYDEQSTHSQDTEEQRGETRSKSGIQSPSESDWTMIDSSGIDT